MRSTRSLTSPTHWLFDVSGHLVNPCVDGDDGVARVEVVELVEVNLVAPDDAGKVGGGEGAVVRAAAVLGLALHQVLGENGELLRGEAALPAVPVLVNHRVDNLLGRNSWSSWHAPPSRALRPPYHKYSKM